MQVFGHVAAPKFPCSSGAGNRVHIPLVTQRTPRHIGVSALHPTRALREDMVAGSFREAADDLEATCE